MKKLILLTAALVLFRTELKSQVIPNGDMESISSCFAGGFIFYDWSDYGCTDVNQNPTSSVHAGSNAMLITNSLAVPAPLVQQAFPVAQPLPTCMSFWGKINLNAGDTVKVRVYFNCNGAWFNCGSWFYTNTNAVSLSYTQYYLPLSTGPLCITGMDSMRIEFNGGKVMNGNMPTGFYIDDVSFNCTTAIKEVAASASSLSFSYSNDGNFVTVNSTLNAAVSTVELCDVNGKKVMEKQNVQALPALDISALAAGIYVCRLRTADGQVLSGKIIRQ